MSGRARLGSVTVALLGALLGCGEGAGTPRPANEAAEPGPAPSPTETPTDTGAPAAEIVAAPRMDGDVVLVDPGEVREKLDAEAPMLLIDARGAADFAQEHIPGAINIPLQTLAAASELPGIARDYEIVVYCIAASCPISKNAARVLARLGYVNVKDMRAGLVGWKRAGFPTATGEGGA
ncbi:MAG: rhodanese-like domain-containing protein [Gemmatimonadota bacterium]